MTRSILVIIKDLHKKTCCYFYLNFLVEAIQMRCYNVGFGLVIKTKLSLNKYQI